MSEKTIQLSFFIALTTILLVLSFLVFKPYLGIIFLSGVLSVAFYPVYEKFLLWFRGNQGVSSLATLVVIVIVIFIPTFLISASVFKEAVGLYNSITLGNEGQEIVFKVDSALSDFAKNFINDPTLEVHIENYFKDVLSWVIGHFDSVFSVVFDGILGFTLMLISIYYFLRNALYVRARAIAWSPLPDSFDKEILEVLRDSVDAVLRGRFLVSIAHGFLIGIGFWIFGIGSPILWGFVGSIASLIPTIGTAIVTVPATIYLFANGHVGAGVGMLIWATVIVGLADNVLSAIILKRSIKINPLIILFSILGGIEFFGPIGFLAGPVLVSAFISVMRIYPFIMSYRKQT